MRLFRAYSGSAALRLFQLGLATFGILAATLVWGAVKAHALEVELFFRDRTTIVLGNVQVTQADYDSLSSQERQGLGISNRQELEALLDRLFDGKEAKDGDIWDTNERYTLTIEGCESVFDDIEPGQNTADIKLSVRAAVGGSSTCVDLTRNDWQIRNPDHITAAFRWVDASTIEPVQGGDVNGLFVRSQSNPNQFLRQSENGRACQDYIQIDPSNPTRGTFHQLQGIASPCGPVGLSNVRVFLLDSGNQSIPAGEGEATPGSGADEEEEDNSCETSGALAWFICPVIKVLDESINFLDSRITALLTIPENDFREPSLRATWSRMRNIALVILVPIMLVMVIGTALGFDFISAYTVKRALPRLVIAAMFIVLSWTFVTFLNELTNNVGRGILGLMTASVGGSENLTLASLFEDPSIQAGIFQWLVVGGTIAAGVQIAATAPGLVLMFAGMVIVALLVGFIVLTLRQLLILALAMLAPLAILAWIFPGNDKLWKLWWQTFSKLLILFPLIELLLGAGRVLAYVVSQTRTDFSDSVVGVFFKLLAWILPYFFIFTLLKTSSAVLGALTGGVFALQKRAQEGLSSRYGERGKDQLRTASLQKRERWQNWAHGKIDASAASGRRGGMLYRGVMTGVAKGVGGHNLQAARSAQRDARIKEMSDQIKSGDDTEVRAGATDANLIAASRGGINALRANKNFTEGEDYRIKDDKLQLRNISGNFYDASKAQAGHDRWGKDYDAMQKMVSYEMYKASEEGDAQNVTDNFLAFTRSHGVSDAQAQGMWIGAGFENQNSRLEYKHTKMQEVTDESGKKVIDKKTGQPVKRMVLDGAALAKEVHEKRGTYDMSKMGSSTIQAMKAAHDQAKTDAVQAGAALRTAQAAGDNDGVKRAQENLDAAQLTQQRVKDSAAALTARLGPSQVTNVDEQGQPVYGGSTGAAAHVDQRIRELNDYVNGSSNGGNGGGGRRPGPPPPGTPGGIVLPPGVRAA